MQKNVLLKMMPNSTWTLDEINQLSPFEREAYTTISRNMLEELHHETKKR